MQLWSNDRAISRLAHGRLHLPAHAPIGLHHRPRVGPTPAARAESDRVACLYPSATVHICNPRMSSAARPDVASASRRSSLEPANAQRLGGSRVGSTRCYPTIESDRCSGVSARPCSHRPTPRSSAHKRIPRCRTVLSPACTAASGRGMSATRG
jgi:hypothetical protein